MLEISNQTFTDGEQAKQYVRGLMARYPLGSEVDVQADFFFLLNLLRRHPNFRPEWAAEAKSIRIVRNRRKRANELELGLRGGEVHQLSWIGCL